MTLLLKFRQTIVYDVVALVPQAEVDADGLVEGEPTPEKLAQIVEAGQRGAGGGANSPLPPGLKLVGYEITNVRYKEA